MITVLGQGKFLKLVSQDSWEFVDRSIGTGVVTIIAVTEGKLILVEQFRRSVGRKVIELPAGLVGDKGKESLAEAALRELEEETGYRAQSLTLLTEGPTASGLATEVVSIFLAHNVSQVGDGGGDETESIEVHKIPLTEVESWAADRSSKGAYVDPKVFAGLYFALTRQSKETGK